MTDSSVTDGARAAVVLVTSPTCHFCEDAHETLAAIAATGTVSLRAVEATSPEGLALVDSHRPAMFPLVLLDDAFFSAGRLPRRKLAHALGLDKAAL